MQVFKFGALVAGVLMMVAQSVMAADNSGPIAGTWTDTLPSGLVMMIDFTPTTVSFYQLDPASGRTSPPTTVPVSYKKEGAAIKLTPTGDEGLPLTVTVKDTETAVLQFEGMDARTLTRQKAQATPRGHGIPAAKPEKS